MTAAADVIGAQPERHIVLDGNTPVPLSAWLRISLPGLKPRPNGAFSVLPIPYVSSLCSHMMKAWQKEGREEHVGLMLSKDSVWGCVALWLGRVWQQQECAENPLHVLDNRRQEKEQGPEVAGAQTRPKFSS